MVKEGKLALKAFCDASDYEYNEKLVDRILFNERRFQEKMNLASKNVLRYPTLRLVLVKLALAWMAASMLYYGIILGTIPGGVLVNNLILGILSTIAGPLMCILLKSRLSNRRLLLSALYLISGVTVLLMAFTTQYKNSFAALIFGSISYGIISGAFRTRCVCIGRYEINIIITEF